MSVVLVAAALVVATGSIAALAAGDPRLGLVGLAAALVGAALLADPLPGPAVLGVRLAAALLAVAILRASEPAASIQARPSEPDAEGRSRLGWPAEAMLGIAGGVAGLFIATGIASFAPVGGTGVGPGPGPLDAAVVLAAGSLALALAGLIAAISLPALLAGRGLRRATAAVLVTQGAILIRIGLAGSPGALEEVVLAALLVAVAIPAALLAGAGRATAEAAARPS